MTQLFRRLPCSECFCSARRRRVAAQPWPSSTIRIVVPDGAEHAAGHHQPPRRQRAVGESEGWRMVVENKPGAIQTHRRQPRCSSSRRTDTRSMRSRCRRRPRRRSCPICRFRFDTDFAPVIKLATAYHVLVTSPFGSGQVAAGAGRSPQEPAGQAHILFRRLRDARASRRRDVQAADRRARHPRSLSAASRRRSPTCSTAPTTTSSSRRFRWSI